MRRTVSFNVYITSILLVPSDVQERENVFSNEIFAIKHIEFDDAPNRTEWQDICEPVTQ